jgi:hypothetical protein
MQRIESKNEAGQELERIEVVEPISKLRVIADGL